MASSDGFPSIPDDPSSLPLTGTSAFVGQPPATQDDYYIVKGLFRVTGTADVNPMMGYFLAAKPPPGYVHETRQISILVGLIFVILLVAVPTVLRIGLRLGKSSSMKFGWDDYTISIGALLALVFPITQIYTVAIGATAKHVWEVTYEQYSTGIVAAMVCRTAFYVAVGMIKLSMTIFIQRLAERLSIWWRISCYIFIASLVGYIGLAIFAIVFSCNPPAAQWDLALLGRIEPVPTCMDLEAQTQVLISIHVAQGLVLLFTPIVILWKVRVPTAKKARLFTIWIIGGLGVLGGLIQQTRPTVTNDLTWDYVEVLVWACLDLSLGTMAASLPVLDGLLEKYWMKAKSTVVNIFRGGQRRGKPGARVWPYSPTASDEEKRKKPTIRHSVSIIGAHTMRTESGASIVSNSQLQDSKSEVVEMGILRVQEVEVRISVVPEDVEKGQEMALDPRAPSPFWHNRPEWHDQTLRL
ncbi:hypothetical protein CGRA01v4_04327 [Colletotrichum graminicola]|uniref:Rhodopsin domain-containing protein n=1 Tax=Colletotrichum graminicola (strain M1.001 / M2 / FGSC 10212) TaxID=645133 RepID=E3Q990_COLGM|nr:uncharacterized protein GLRG_01764 [Colletotrichum graminicola M1.001]EFQ27269.1 hypothetical protein GLRG_01764 [Colletotrichum graminicola M1.001]WDK13046.1 hypothetical protein CGRA01v4_04327 [Colletotrichum graminicola]